MQAKNNKERLQRPHKRPRKTRKTKKQVVEQKNCREIFFDTDVFWAIQLLENDCLSEDLSEQLKEVKEGANEIVNDWLESHERKRYTRADPNRSTRSDVYDSEAPQVE